MRVKPRHRFLAPGVLAALCALALLALPALASAANKVRSNATTENTYLEGTQAGTLFEIPSKKFSESCSSGKFTGTMKGHETSEITLHPRYNNEEATCSFTVSGNSFPTRVKTAGCNFGFTGVPLTGEAAGGIELGCETGKKIEIGPLLGCSISLSPQSFTGFHYANTAEGTVAMSAAATGISYTTTGCSSFGLSAKGSDGVWSNTINLAGYEEVGSELVQRVLWAGEPWSAGFHSRSSTDATYLEGTAGNQAVFHFGTFEFGCGTAKYAGEIQGSSEEFSTSSVALHPEISNCTLDGSAPKINTTGCNFENGVGGALAVACETGHAMTISLLYGCVVEIGSQSATGSVQYANGITGGALSVSMSMNPTLNYKSSSCGFYGLKAEGTMSLSNQVTIIGFLSEAGVRNPNVRVPFWIV